jgi:hypothetical protein
MVKHIELTQSKHVIPYKIASASAPSYAEACHRLLVLQVRLYILHGNCWKGEAAEVQKGFSYIIHPYSAGQHHRCLIRSQ